VDEKKDVKRMREHLLANVSFLFYLLANGVSRKAPNGLRAD